MDKKKTTGKRRGRKPKNKPKEKAPPKKRGRKPKKKDPNVVKEKKKRGRKPQNKSYGFKKESVTNYIDTDNIIVHLPIKDIDNNLGDIVIQSGMTADVTIIGQKRTVFGYIFSPVTKLKRQAFREK